VAGCFGSAVGCPAERTVGGYRTVEDVGIVLGRACGQALGDKADIARYGHAYVPMDEPRARCVVDLSGRFYLHFDATFTRDTVGDLATEMIEHFWYSFAEQVRCNLHLTVLYGRNTHHQIEAIFKSAARALHAATHRNPDGTAVLSTKGQI